MPPVSPTTPVIPRKIFVRNDRLFEGRIVGGTTEHPSLVNIVPLTMTFFDEVDEIVMVVGDGCPCKLTGAFMAALGMPYSSRMHLYPEIERPASDFLIHIGEEDDSVLPLQRAIGFTADAAEIAKDHERFRRQYERGIPWAKQEIDKHAHREDKMIERVMGRMKAMLAKPAPMPWYPSSAVI